MNWQAVGFDWNQVRAFLATAEEGSLSAAARALGLTQPTLSRQVSELEAELAVTLFERGKGTMQLTDTGHALLEHVRAMGEAAARVSLAAAGRSEDIDGRVRITTTEGFGMMHLPAIVERIREQAPGIELEIIAANESLDLLRREADIAIRHVRPEHGDLIAQRVGSMTGHFYASKAFLDAAGRPRVAADLASYDFIGFESRDRLLGMFNEMGIPVTSENFKVYSASGVVILALMERGLGISVMTRDVAATKPSLEIVLPELPPFDIEVWLVTHRELKTSRRIRLVFDTIAGYVKEMSETYGTD
ncbi:MAG: LysR family transcriptional regulator [Pseudomonadota bacterium]